MKFSSHKAILAWQLRMYWHNFVTDEELELFEEEIVKIFESEETIKEVKWK